MKTLSFFVALATLSLHSVCAAATTSSFKSSITNIPPPIKQQMLQYTWRQGCPVPIKDLAYLQLSYWGNDNKHHTGELIVNKTLAKEVVALFKTLYENKYPIAQMQLIDVFKGDDDASMSANNTSAFNCRPVTNRPGEYSQHSYGRAIDINPLINPYVKGNLVLPKAGSAFVDRNKPYKGKITRDSFIYQQFSNNGWDWGGGWFDLQDNQHFEKRAQGEKRNPYGYDSAGKPLSKPK